MVLMKSVSFTKSTLSCNVKFAFALLSSSSTRRRHAMRKTFNVSPNKKQLRARDEVLPAPREELEGD